MDVVTLLHGKHVSVCNGNTTAIPTHVSVLNCKFIYMIIIIKIAHVITASRDTQTVVRLEKRGWVHSADTLGRSVSSACK